MLLFLTFKEVSWRPIYTHIFAFLTDGSINFEGLSLYVCKMLKIGALPSFEFSDLNYTSSSHNLRQDTPRLIFFFSFAFYKIYQLNQFLRY